MFSAVASSDTSNNSSSTSGGASLISYGSDLNFVDDARRRQAARLRLKRALVGGTGVFKDATGQEIVELLRDAPPPKGKKQPQQCRPARLLVRLGARDAGSSSSQ